MNLAQCLLNLKGVFTPIEYSHLAAFLSKVTYKKMVVEGKKKVRMPLDQNKDRKKETSIEVEVVYF